jgi:hypothetical protein
LFVYDFVFFLPSYFPLSNLSDKNSDRGIKSLQLLLKHGANLLALDVQKVSPVYYSVLKCDQQLTNVVFDELIKKKNAGKKRNTRKHTNTTTQTQRRKYKIRTHTTT